MGLGEFVDKLIDPYDKQARLYPGLIVFIPIAVLVVFLYGGQNFLASSLLSILGFSGAAYLLASSARNAGKKIEDRLFATWGGKPTTQLLRHSDHRIDKHTKERIHLILSQKIGKQLPNLEQETSNPSDADELYKACVVWLINNTRDVRKFPLVFKENIAYGFRRNMLGLKNIGIFVAVISIVWVLLYAHAFTPISPYFNVSGLLQSDIKILVPLIVSSVILIIWIFLVNESALKQVSFAYAERLLHSCDTLAQTTPKHSKKSV